MARVNYRVGKRSFAQDDAPVLVITAFFLFFALYLLGVLAVLGAIVYGLVVYGPDLIVALIEFLRSAA